MISAAQRARPVRVVIIDDTYDLRELLRLALTRGGLEVVGEAGDGLSGIECVRLEKPDVVLLDLSMPVMDGLEALPTIRRLVPQAKIVVLSGFGATQMSEKAMTIGADGYLQKGMALKRIIEYVKDIVDAPRPVRQPAVRKERPDRARAGDRPRRPPARRCPWCPTTSTAQGADAVEALRRGGRRRQRHRRRAAEAHDDGPARDARRPPQPGRVDLGRAGHVAVRRHRGRRRAALPAGARQPDRAAHPREPGPLRHAARLGRAGARVAGRLQPAGRRVVVRGRRERQPDAGQPAPGQRLAARLPGLVVRGHRHPAPRDRHHRPGDPRPGRGALRRRRVDHPGRRRDVRRAAPAAHVVGDPAGPDARQHHRRPADRRRDPARHAAPRPEAGRPAQP